ncbi:MAG: hypothetical protein ACO27F_06155 [Beijerinckiaceae bacterium]|jgi:hypothetical protein
MRTLFGMIVGAALTVGFAYLIDQRRLADPAGEGPLVNWERVDKSWRETRESLRQRWRNLTQ